MTELNSARPVNSPAKITGQHYGIADPTRVDKLWVDLESDNIAVDVPVLNAAESSSAKITDLQKMTPFFNMNITANPRMADGFVKQGPLTGKLIINISSIAIHACGHGNMLNVTAYGSSKAAAASALQAAADCKSVEECQISCSRLSLFV